MVQTAKAETDKFAGAAKGATDNAAEFGKRIAHACGRAVSKNRTNFFLSTENDNLPRGLIGSATNRG
jgi:hypothetical protein